MGERIVWELVRRHAVGKVSVHRNSLFSLFAFLIIRYSSYRRRHLSRRPRIFWKAAQLRFLDTLAFAEPPQAFVHCVSWHSSSLRMGMHLPLGIPNIPPPSGSRIARASRPRPRPNGQNAMPRQLFFQNYGRAATVDQAIAPGSDAYLCRCTF